jgi:hypothetical protein
MVTVPMLESSLAQFCSTVHSKEISDHIPIAMPAKPRHVRIL